jgi:hypothetical protein
LLRSILTLSIQITSYQQPNGRKTDRGTDCGADKQSKFAKFKIQNSNPNLFY